MDARRPRAPAGRPGPGLRRRGLRAAEGRRRDQAVHRLPRQLDRRLRDPRAGVRGGGVEPVGCAAVPDVALRRHPAVVHGVPPGLRRVRRRAAARPQARHAGHGHDGRPDPPPRPRPGREPEGGQRHQGGAEHRSRAERRVRHQAPAVRDRRAVPPPDDGELLVPRRRPPAGAGGLPPVAAHRPTARSGSTSAVAAGIWTTRSWAARSWKTARSRSPRSRRRTGRPRPARHRTRTC